LKYARLYYQLAEIEVGGHLTNFREHFPHINIIPKQHYMIHIPSMIKDLGPHNYFKELARKQNFKKPPKVFG
jgi:hypothetical protein